MSEAIKTIVLPTRPQTDTIVAIFILKRFGTTIFPGIENAAVEVWQVMPQGENEGSLNAKGVVVLDLGGGRFDHHGKDPKTTAATLVAHHLGIAEDPALAKLLEWAERDDFYGKGTVSPDPLDRAFGLSGLIMNLNRKHPADAASVVNAVLPLIEAHYEEEVRRTQELPKEFEEKLQSGDAELFSVKQRDKNLKVVVLTSDNSSLAGYLRSQLGGRFDVVTQWLSSGHANILTRPTKRVDLRALAAVIRAKELALAGKPAMSPHDLARPGRAKEVPEWYYDPATNSIQNGGLSPKEVPATKIPKDELSGLIEAGLAADLRDLANSG